MPKNITYHQTAAQKARRTRNDSVGVASLGMAGLGATRGKAGFVGNKRLKASMDETNRFASASHKASGEFEKPRERVLGHVTTEMGRVGNLARDVRRTVHPGRGLSEAAVGAGIAGAVAGEARNIYHTHQEQKLRRVSKAFLEEEVSKAMDKKYCKRHDKFDTCAAEVTKAYQAAPKPGDPGFMGHAIKNAHKRHRAALKAKKESVSESNAFSKSAVTTAQAAQKYNPKNISTENMRRVGDGMVGAGALAGTAAFVPKKLRPGAALATAAGGSIYAGTKIHQKANKKDVEAMSKRDDGIRHKIGSDFTVKTSRESRGQGKLVACEVGNREVDGTPRTGRDAAARHIRPENKMGSSKGTKPVGTSSIKEQIPGGVRKSADPFEVFSKDNGKQMSGGRRVMTQVAPGLHGAIVGKPGKKLRAAGNEYGAGMLGSIAGHAAGIGTAMAFRKPEAAPLAAGVGGAAGAITGVQMGASRNARKGYYQPIHKAAADPFELSKADSPATRERKRVVKEAATRPAEVEDYIKEKKKDLSKSADPFEISKAFGEGLDMAGAVKNVMPAAKQMGSALRPALKKPAILGGAVGAGTGGVLGQHKMRSAAIGGVGGAAGTLGAMKLLKA